MKRVQHFLGAKPRIAAEIQTIGLYNKHTTTSFPFHDLYSIIHSRCCKKTTKKHCFFSWGKNKVGVPNPELLTALMVINHDVGLS